MTKLALDTHDVTTTDGIKLAAYTSGNPKATPLVFVHGYPDNHKVWLPIMSKLADDYFLVCYDVRGAGASDRPDSVDAYQIRQLADDLWSVTSMLLKDKPFHLIGHDWGSIQSWESVCQPRFDGKMLSFTSISGPSLDHVGFLLRRPLKKPVAKLKQALSSWYIYSFHVPALANFFWHRLAPRWHTIQKIGKNPTQLDDALDGMKLYRANIFKKQMRPDPKYAICPVHLVILEKDQFVNPVLFEGLDQWVSTLSVTRLPLRHWGIYHEADQMASAISKCVT